MHEFRTPFLLFEYYYEILMLEFYAYILPYLFAWIYLFIFE